MEKEGGRPLSSPFSSLGSLRLDPISWADVLQLTCPEKPVLAGRLAQRDGSVAGEHSDGLRPTPAYCTSFRHFINKGVRGGALR